MKNPNPINLKTSEEIRKAGWQAETRDADGHLTRTHAPFGDDDVGIVWLVREALEHGETVTIWPTAHTSPPEQADAWDSEKFLLSDESLPCRVPQSDDNKDAIAWEATTICYTKYITDARYQKFSHAVRQWYKPFKCSSCEADGKDAEIDSLSDELLCCSEAHEAAKALIQELVTALAGMDRYDNTVGARATDALAKAKEQGYEP